MSWFDRLARRAPPPSLEALYLAVAAQAREPAFYADLGVPDTIDGRFDLLCLHAALAIERLRREPDGDALGQALFDRMFEHLDLGLREMGVQDLGVGRRIKAMAEGFRGRSLALRAALAAGDGATLRATLVRNVFGAAIPSDAALDALARYVEASAAALAAADGCALMRGEAPFPPAPAVSAEGAAP